MVKDSDKKPISILLVDDHKMFVDGLRLLLKSEKNFVFTGIANSGKQALEMIKEENPDLVITDINMPEMSGIELTKQVKSSYPNIHVLVLTMYNDREIINEIIMAEADGYILKNTSKQELVTAINQVINYGAYYSNEVSAIMMENLKKENRRREEIKDLTAREVEILRLICQEYSSLEIAEKLSISVYTVDTHRKNILQKTKAKTIVGLIKFAITNGIIKDII